MKRLLLFPALAVIVLSACTKKIVDLPREKAPQALEDAFGNYVKAIEEAGEDIHSIMIVQHGKVLEEKWFGDAAPDVPHVLHSVSKTFTSAAVGLAINDGLLSLDDRLVDLFPDKLPSEVSENLKKSTIKDLLTMSGGHDKEPSLDRSDPEADWEKIFLAAPFDHEPGQWFWYNSLGTYMLSAAVQKVTGRKVVEYLDERLFGPLNIATPKWEESPQGINCGGWGLYLRTEDLAKMGQLILQKGKWNGKQVLPASWVKEMTTAHIYSAPAGWSPDAVRDNKMKPEDSDWLQGYCYQMWRCRHNAVRADGAWGQYIIVMPDQDAVIAVTAKVGDMQKEINYIWDYLLPALEEK